MSGNPVPERPESKEPGADPSHGPTTGQQPETTEEPGLEGPGVEGHFTSPPQGDGGGSAPLTLSKEGRMAELRGQEGPWLGDNPTAPLPPRPQEGSENPTAPLYDAGQRDQVRPQPLNPDDRQGQPEFPHVGSAPQGYPPQGAQEQGYQEQGYRAPGYQEPGYPQDRYQQSYPQGGYGQPGYPQPGYQQPGYLQQGYPQPGYGQPMGEQKSKLAAGLLGIFLGALGIHNFYLGRTGVAIAQLLITVVSLGILSPVSAIWGFVEGIMILAGAEPFQRDAKGIPLRD